MNVQKNKFDATNSMTGYLYQCREALLLALNETKNFPNLFVSVERFDDVAFEEGGTPLQQLQLKHHCTPGNLTDSSADLWKTLRIWSEQVKSTPQLPLDCRFIIITTNNAADGSIASRLRYPRSSDVDNDLALKALLKIATSSNNQETQSGRDAFLALTDGQQKSLIQAIHVRDRSPSIVNARSEIEDMLTFSVPAAHIANLVDHLEGWWFSQIIKSLSTSNSPPIPLIVLRQKIDEIATAFRTDQLLVHSDVLAMAGFDPKTVETRNFVKQLQCIGVGLSSIEFAKRDYYRATTQRSIWARENVLLDGEASRYDQELVDRLERERLARGETANWKCDEDKMTFGRELFHWANRSELSFRNRHETWLCAGSYQILSDQVLLGWHPDHKTLFGFIAANDEAA